MHRPLLYDCPIPCPSLPPPLSSISFCMFLEIFSLSLSLSFLCLSRAPRPALLLLSSSPLQQAAMLETLLTHLDAAASNGAATEAAPAAEKTAEEPKKDDAAPAEVSEPLRAHGRVSVFFQSCGRKHQEPGAAFIAFMRCNHVFCCVVSNLSPLSVGVSPLLLLRLLEWVYRGWAYW